MEDIEEATPEGSHDRTFASQVPQCKAILLGLDLTLQPIRCQEQQSSQPQSILAAKASVQIMTNCLAYALDNTSAPRQEAVLTQDTPAEGGAFRRSTQLDASNDDAQSTYTSSAATYTTFSNRSSAKVTGLESNQLLKTSVISLQAIVNGKRALKPIPYHDATSAPAGTGPIDWRPPFSLSDSVSSNDTKAHEPLTEPVIKFPPTIPRITIRNCDNEAPETTADILMDSSSSDTDHSKSSCNSDRSEDQYGSPTSTTSQIDQLQPGHSNANPTAQVYMPYRPWYCTPESSTSVTDKLQNVCNADDTIALHELENKQNTTELADISPLNTATDILLAEPPPIARCEDVKHQPRQVLPNRTETTHAVPIMPARPPPRPPMTRNKLKPPVPPPRRRLVRDVHPFLSAEEGFSSTSTPPASTQVASSIGSQGRFSPVTDNEPRLLVSLQDVLDRSLAIRRRASTGDLAIGTTHTHSATSRLRPAAEPHRDGLLRIPYHPSQGFDRRLSRPASTPELKTFESCAIREALQDQRVAETKRIQDICESFNGRQWAKVEAYLTYHLNTLEPSANSERTRRVRHLLGVCASYRGHWRRALSLFISVLRTPVEDTTKLDDGDRAAFYWLADTYALLGRPREALLAYCLAGSCCQSTSGLGSSSFWRCLIAEQNLLRHTVSDAAFEATWADGSFLKGQAADGQLLHPTIASQDVAQACLKACSTRAEKEKDCKIHAQNHSPANQAKPNKPEQHQMHISPLHFDPSQIWPMPHDSTFSTTNVAQGLFFPRETDLLKGAQNHPETLLPRQSFSFPISRTVPGEGLTHLIPALRETLQTLFMGWCKVLEPRDVGFMVAYTAIENGIATINYFKLEILRIPFSTDFGLVFCSGKTSSSARKTSEVSRIGRRLATAAARRAVRAYLRATLGAVCERRRAVAAADSSKMLPPLPPLTQFPVQPLPLPIAPAPAPAPSATPPPSRSPSRSPPPSSKEPTTTTKTTTTGTSASLPEVESSLPCTPRSSNCNNPPLSLARGEEEEEEEEEEEVSTLISRIFSARNGW